MSKARRQTYAGRKQKMADLVPTNWLDPLLTGPGKVIKDGYTFDCKDIERLLLAIQARIAAVERTAKP